MENSQLKVIFGHTVLCYGKFIVMGCNHIMGKFGPIIVLRLSVSYLVMFFFKDRGNLLKEIV